YSSSATVWENFINNSTAQWQKAHPGVKIVFVGPFDASTEGDYYTKLDLMTSSPSTAPSVMLEDMFYTATYVNEKIISPLNSYMNSSVISSFYPSALGQMTINGTIYGLPAQVTDTLIYYNITLFKEAGIPVPWQPSNWTDIITAAQTLESKLGNSISGFIPMNIYAGTRGDEASSFTGFEGLLYGTGWGLYNFTDSKWYGFNPGLNATMHFYKTVFVTDNLASVDLSTTPYITVGQYMQEGKLGIAIDGSWMYGYQWAPGAAHAISNFSKYIGVAKIPTEFGQPPYYSTMVGGWGWAMYSGVSDKSLVYSFMAALDNTTNQIRINLPGNALAGGLPTTVNASSNPLFSKLMPTDPALDAYFASLLAYGHYRPPVAAYPTVSSALDAAMSDVVVGGETVRSALASYESTLVSALGSSAVQEVYAPTIGPGSATNDSNVIVSNDINLPGFLQSYYNNEYVISDFSFSTPLNFFRDL
ncbi:MAG: extracellular solute-binding protein, partial [Candidatus Micrarchaeaceae archaeon]